MWHVRGVGAFCTPALIDIEPLNLGVHTPGAFVIPGLTIEFNICCHRLD